MPIVKKNSSYTLEYTIPEKMYPYLTDTFLEKFRQQIAKRSKMDSKDYIYYCGTFGWDKCLMAACIQTGSMDVYDYYCSLEWYDRDMFDGELLYLVENMEKAAV